MDSVNLYQLAKELGLSTSTVSKALKDSYEISAATKSRVVEMAKKLNYQPNPHASGLRKHKSKTIGVVFPQVDNNFLASAIKGIQLLADKRGYHVLLYLTYDDPVKEVSIFNLLKNGRIDGVVVSTVCHEENLQHITEVADSIPVIFIDRVPENFNTTKITTDDVASSFKAVEHLIMRGCRKIAYMYVLQNFSIGKRRLQGYLNALKSYNMPVDESLIIKCNQDYEGNYQLVKNLLDSPNKPDGILSPVEKMALTTYSVCQELKMNIPADIKIISFTNLSYASLLYTPLTTVTPPAYEMGEKAATLLINAIEKEKIKLYNENIMLPATVFERDSTKRV